MTLTAPQQRRLADYLGRARSTPFQPGQHDCALFASGAVEAMTGRDLAASWRGRYRTLRGGLRVLRREGYADHIALAEAHFRRRVEGEPPEPGDLAVIATETGPALGVVQGTQIYALHETGLALVPLDAASVFFAVT